MPAFLKRLLGFLGFMSGMFALTYGFNTYLFNTIVCHIPSGYTTLLLGHSHVRVSLDPKVVKTGIHATLGAQPYTLSYVKLKYLLKHNPHLKQVVLGFSPHDFSDYQDEKLLRQPWMHTFFEQFMPIFPLSDLAWMRVNRQQFLRRWVRDVLLPNRLYVGLIGRWRAGEPIHPRQFPFFGRFSSYREPRLPQLMKGFKLEKYPYRMSGVSKRHYYVKGALRQVSATQVESFRRLMDLCRAHNLMVYLYTPPLHRWYRQHVPPRFQETYRALRDHYEAFAHVRVIDLSALELPADHFWDAEHVNIKGMAIASRLVNDILLAGTKQTSETK